MMNKIALLAVTVNLITSGLAQATMNGQEMMLGQERGGGSTLAAEIGLAMDDFIELVEQRPDIFPELDVQELKAQRPQIFVTSKSLTVCNSDWELDAYSNRQENHSVFNIQSWNKKQDTQKIMLAGHELLVLTGIEKSNEYDISDRVLSVLYPAPVSASSIGANRFDRQLKRNIKRMNDAVASYVNGDIDVDTALWYVEDIWSNVRLALQTAMTRKAIELENQVFLFSSREEAFTEWSNELVSSAKREVITAQRRALAVLAEQEGVQDIKCVDYQK